MATNNKPTLYYRVVVGHNPSNPAEIIKHPAITRRETYSIERVINAAIDSGRIRGKLYDLYGVINGFMDQMKTLMENGIAINAGFMRLHAELTGQLGDSEQLTAVNGLATCVTPLTALKLDREKFNWQRVDDNGIKLSLSTIKGEGCKIGFVRSGSTARINGRNCFMDEDDTVTFVLDGETVACEVLGSDEDTIEIRIPEVAEEHLSKEYVFTVSSHCGIEDGPLQVKTIRAKLLAAEVDPTAPKITGYKVDGQPVTQFTANASFVMTGENLAAFDMLGGRTDKVVMTFTEGARKGEVLDMPYQGVSSSPRYAANLGGIYVSTPNVELVSGERGTLQVMIDGKKSNVIPFEVA